MATKRQKKAAEKLSENIGNSKGQKVSMGKILKEAGYSESVCKTPQRVTKSKGWEELMEEYFPKEKLLRVHRRLLNKKEIVAYQGKYIKTNQLHSDVKYALDMLYKLGGFYKQDNKLNIDERKEYESYKEKDEELKNMTLEEIEEDLERLESHPLIRMQYYREGKEKRAKQNRDKIEY